MVGQKSVLSIVNNYTIDTLPHSIILVGKEGCGKHVLSHYISDKFNLDLLDITEELSEELINNIYRNASVRLYLVDLRKITDKDQNILLKLFEEPPSNAFIILLTNSLFSVLPTIQNRGFIITFENYHKQELLSFAQEKSISINEDYLGTVIETPGDLLKVESLNIDISKIEGLVDKVITKLNIASYANTQTVVDKLNFKDEFDKIDVDFFLKVLYVNSVKTYKENTVKLNRFIAIVQDTINKLVDTRLNKKLAIAHMLSELWFEVRK